MQSNHLHKHRHERHDDNRDKKRHKGHDSEDFTRFKDSRDSKGSKGREHHHRDKGDRHHSSFRNPQTIAEMTKKLPIYQHSKRLLDTINGNQVVIISGDTGCGKSTQVPKYIFLDCKATGKRCNVICTQPRRLAAINLARRVSEELDGRLGDLVGYQIAMDSKQRGEATQIVFVTTGILLQKLIHEPDKVLSDYTHIILDEIHERDIDSDFIMIAIKHLLQNHPSLRLILMSATINAELFSRYFSSYQILCCSRGIIPIFEEAQSSGRSDGWWHPPRDKEKWVKHKRHPNDPKEEWGFERPPSVVLKKEETKEGPSMAKLAETAAMMKQEAALYDRQAFEDHPAPIVQVSEGKMHRIREYFLDTIDDFSKNLATLSPKEFNRDRAVFIQDCILVCLDIIACIMRIDEPDDRHTGSILVFLPGLNEIYQFIDYVEERFASRLDQLVIILLHSTLVDFYQDQLFERPGEGRRKLILATNIAESSITIPDVKYVVDFCLTKEINYNPKTNMERLELSWSCIASSRQRAGRTGRVSDGYCFRLVPRDFYEKKLMKFSKPELQRCPLDRLILKIKLLNKYDTTTIFGEPEKVLGRAIEPPDLENIDLAIRLLQDSGAVGIASEQFPTGEITYLGEIYCDLPMDIRISKLCLLGYVFNCLRESVIISSIIQQQRSIFMPDTKSHPRDAYLFCKTILEYDRGCKSDSILMLRIFDDWEKNFGHKIPRFLHKPKRLIDKKNLTSEESSWCQQRCLDPMILREVLILKEDIKRRLTKYNINEVYMDQVLDLSKSESILRLKILVAAAFFSKYLKSEVSIQDKLLRSAETMQANYKMDSYRTLIVNNTGLDTFTLTPERQEQEQKLWKLAFGRFGEVEKIKFIDSKAYVMFSDPTYYDAIMHMLYLKYGKIDETQPLFAGQGPQPGGNTFSSVGGGGPVAGNGGNGQLSLRLFNRGIPANSLLPKRNPSEQDLAVQTVLNRISGIDYTHFTLLNDAFTFKKIAMDSESVNRFIFEDKGKPGSSKVVVCYEYQERGHKGFARHTTLMPEINMMLPLLVLLFSSTPELIPDEEETRYSRIRIKDIEIDLDYYLMDSDLQDINEIRYKVCKTLSAEGLLSSPPMSLWDDIMNLLRRKRMKCIDQERWQQKFEHDRLTSIEKEKLRPSNLVTNAFSGLMKPEVAALNRPFLPEIKRKALKKAGAITWNDQRLSMMRDYETKYKQWKREKLRDLQNFSMNIEIKEAFLVCGRCGFKIGETRCIYDGHVQKLENQYTFRQIKCSRTILYELLFNPQDEFCAHPGIKKLLDVKAELTYYGCKENHIFAVKFAQIDELFISDFSNLQILYPNLKCAKFELQTFDREAIEKETQISLIEQKQRLANSLECVVCFETFSNIVEFRRHIREDKIHKLNHAEFIRNLDDLA